MPKKPVVEYDGYTVENLDFDNPDEIINQVIESKPIRKVKKSDYREISILNPKTNRVQTVLQPKQKRNHPDIDKLKARLEKAREKRDELKQLKLKAQQALEVPQVLKEPPTQATQQALYQPDTIRDLVRSEILQHLSKPRQQRGRQPVYDDEDEQDIEVAPVPKARARKPVYDPPQVPVKNSNIEVSKHLVQSNNAYNPMNDIFGIPY